ncbi:hypothetical protein DFP72DRAFT_1127657, partial [Ephemerocybe angulata]
MKLFDSITFHLSPSLRHETRDLLQHVLLANGAAAAGTLGDATHVITNSNRYEGWEGVGADVAVVTEKWVERSLLLGKLQPIRLVSSFRALVAHLKVYSRLESPFDGHKT